MDNTSSLITSTIPGLIQIQRPVYTDERGFFKETVRIAELEKELGSPFRVAQMNHARSKKNALRGIHTAPWNKLIYVANGKVQVVIVDLREDSETFGKHESFILGEDNRSSIFIPAHCGNSYLVLSENADYLYLADQEWVPNKEIGIAWNDPDLSIEWKIEGEALLSEKDRKNPTLKTLFPTKF